MIIDEAAFKESSFTLLAKDDYLSYLGKNSIEKTLKKYNILKNKDYLSHSSESNYLLLLNYIEKKYYFNEILPSEIVLIIQNDLAFKEYILNSNKKRLTKLFTNDSAIYFKEIITIINFLSNGSKYNIFINYDTYDYTEIARLFRDYEKLLKEYKTTNNKLFDITFKLYTQLFKTYNQLCAINYLDMHRKASIRHIVDLNMESINTLKMQVVLSEVELNKLNYHLAKELYHFTHLNYISASDKTIKELIRVIHDLLKKQADGYSLAKTTKFGGKIQYESREYAFFKVHSSYLLLLLLKKLKHSFDHIDFKDLKELEKTTDLYNKSFTVKLHNKEHESFDALEVRLLNTIIHNYEYQNTNNLLDKNYKSVIDDFILTGDEFISPNLKHIHNILLFAEDLEEDKYLDIAQILIQSPRIKNDYYEYYKLKTIDIIINYYIKNKTNVDLLQYIQKVHLYLQKHKNASHLLSIFSKVSLSITHYYSQCTLNLSLEKALNEYSIFINMNGNLILDNQYKAINEKILLSFGKSYIKDLEVAKNKVLRKDLISLGQKVINNYLKYSELQLKFYINEELSNLTNKILNQKYLDASKIQSILSNLISQKIFYGICEVIVKGLTSKSSEIIDLGYKYYNMELINNFTIQFVFPAVYESMFKNILNKNKYFIKTNISNLLSNFLYSSKLNINHATSLENIYKLKSDLLLYTDEPLTFMEIYISSFNKINQELGFELGESFILSIANKIKSLIHNEDKIYYLNNGRIGIILSTKTSFKILSDKIKNLKITKNQEIIDCDFKIVVTSSNKDDILTLSHKQLFQKIRKNKNTLLSAKD